MTDPADLSGSAIPSATGPQGSDELGDATLDNDGGDSNLVNPDGAPLPADQGGLSSDEGSASEWDSAQDLSIADEETDRVLPNGGRPVTDGPGIDGPVTDDLGRLHPDTDPMSNDNR